MNPFKADLHCHSYCSDGSYSPTQLIELAKKKELNGLSITDHDTIAAYKEALPYAEMHHLPLISGIEFSAAHQGQSVHILAYSFALDSPHIHALCKTHKTRRERRNQAIIKKLAAQHMPIILSEQRTHAIGRPHIARAMVDAGYVFSIEEAFKKYLGEHKACYVPGTTVSVAETLHTIHQAQGMAILAHPHFMTPQKKVKELLEMPFDGIECYYCRCGHSQNQKWIAIAQQKNWFITGGSDFHGEMKPQIELGCSWVGEETFYKLHTRFEANNPPTRRNKKKPS